jgi:7-cyano-7-deazaguanine synthase in queuosine biosynthesis
VIKSTDRQVYPRVYMALSTIYNKHYKPEHSSAVASMVHKALPVLKRILGLEHVDINVRVCPIKDKYTNGRYYNSTRTVWIDARNSVDRSLAVLCHEMVHAQQYATGRLTSSGNYSTWQRLVRHRMPPTGPCRGRPRPLLARTSLRR